MIRSDTYRQQPAQFTYHQRPRMGRMGDVSLASTAISGGIGAGISLVTTGLSLWMNSIQQSHAADTDTTLIVNNLAQQLSNLVAAYQAEPNVTCADQRHALDAYDSAWTWLQSPAACGGHNYGSAGNRCISDRAPGGKFPWQTYYRDPIAHDPRLASVPCDTGLSVYLPSVATGSYSDTGITSTGGSTQTGQTAAQIAAAAAAAGGMPASSTSSSSSTAPPATTILPGVPNAYLYAGAAALALLAVIK